MQRSGIALPHRNFHLHWQNLMKRRSASPAAAARPGPPASELPLEEADDGDRLPPRRRPRPLPRFPSRSRSKKDGLPRGGHALFLVSRRRSAGEEDGLPRRGNAGEEDGLPRGNHFLLFYLVSRGGPQQHRHLPSHGGKDHSWPSTTGVARPSPTTPAPPRPGLGVTRPDMLAGSRNQSRHASNKTTTRNDPRRFAGPRQTSEDGNYRRGHLFTQTLFYSKEGRTVMKGRTPESRSYAQVPRQRPQYL